MDNGDWLRIDALEVDRGRCSPRPRVKLCSIDELLAAAHGAVTG